MKYRTPLMAAALAAGLVLAGCAKTEDTNDPPSQTDATAQPDAAGHNSADVEFAQQMIPHHEQALEMAKLAPSRAESQAVKDLAADIEAAQDPEIQTMTGWLEDWDEDVPDDSGSMEGMDHGSGDMDSMGEGMMSEDDMSKLEAASGAEFDRMFLAMMIEHHEGAITMAKEEQTEGENPDAVKLAEQIESAQTEEIQTMRKLLAE